MKNKEYEGYFDLVDEKIAQLMKIFPLDNNGKSCQFIGSKQDKANSLSSFVEFSKNMFKIN